MPSPLYMLCCLSGSWDKETNQVSHFNVIESLEIKLQRQPAEKAQAIPFVISPLSFQIVATWALGKHDKPSDTYEVEILFERPEEPGKKVIHQSEFHFGKGNHRFTVNFILLPRDDFKTGVLWFECRIRKVGTSKWLRQEYTIPVVVTVIDDASEPQKNGKKKSKRR